MEAAEGIGILFSGVLIVFCLIFYIAIFAGGIFLWYFIVKKAIIKGINQSILNKDSSKHEREIYLLKLEVNRLKAVQEAQAGMQKEVQGQAERAEASNEVIQEADIAVEAAIPDGEQAADTRDTVETVVADATTHSIDIAKSADLEANEAESMAVREDEEQIKE